MKLVAIRIHRSIDQAGEDVTIQDQTDEKVWSGIYIHLWDQIKTHVSDPIIDQVIDDCYKKE